MRSPGTNTIDQSKISSARTLCPDRKKNYFRPLNTISEFCTAQNIQWKFKAPHFGSLWEAAVKSMKIHLKIVGGTKLNFEELTTVLTQIEACWQLCQAIVRQFWERWSRII